MYPHEHIIIYLLAFWTLPDHNFRQVGTITGLDHWTGLLEWTTGLTQNAKYNSFSTEQKLNFARTAPYSTASFLEVKGHVHI